MNTALQKTLVIILVGFDLFAQAQTTVKNTELLPIVGSWQGTLTYVDYTSKQKTVIPATIDIEQIKLGVFTFAHQFPKEPHVKWTDTVAISKDGTYLGHEKIVAKHSFSDGSLEFTTEQNGKDDDKVALLRRTYTIAPTRYVVRKDVQYEGSNEWLNRHEYRYETRAKLLMPKQMKADLKVLKTTWEILHPGLYRYNTKAEIEGYFAAMDAQTNAPMEQRKFFMLVSQLNIKLNCGHSFVSYYNNKRIIKNNLYSTVLMPVLFRVVEGKFVITHNLTDNQTVQLGDEITAINGIETQTIIDSLLTVSKADGRNGLNKKWDNVTLHPREIYTDRYSLFDIFFPLFFKKELNDTDFWLRIKSVSGTQRTLQVTGLSKEIRQAKYIEKYGDLPKDENSWNIKPINSQTVLFRLGDFMTYKWKFDFNKYLDSVFTHISQKGYKNLILDIRQNEGGADEARNAVLGYLIPNDLNCAMTYRKLYRYNAIPDSLNQYLNTWDDDFRKPKPDSLYFKTDDGYYESRIPNKCIAIVSKPNHFKGKIYLITDVTNSSATFTMADVFKQNNLGTIVGETTGGTQQGINGGEIFFLYLPNSKIEMDVPLVYQAPKVPRPDEGIKPDFEVKTTALDLSQMRDAPMEFILSKLIN